jgi:hypothetical protein
MTPAPPPPAGTKSAANPTSQIDYLKGHAAFKKQHVPLFLSSLSPALSLLPHHSPSSASFSGSLFPFLPISAHQWFPPSNPPCLIIPFSPRPLWVLGVRGSKQERSSHQSPLAPRRTPERQAPVGPSVRSVPVPPASNNPKPSTLPFTFPCPLNLFHQPSDHLVISLLLFPTLHHSKQQRPLRT